MARNTLTPRGVAKVLQLAALQSSDPVKFLDELGDLLEDACMSGEMEEHEEGVPHTQSTKRLLDFAADLTDELEEVETELVESEE